MNFLKKCYHHIKATNIAGVMAPNIISDMFPNKLQYGMAAPICVISYKPNSLIEAQIKMYTIG